MIDSEFHFIDGDEKPDIDEMEGYFQARLKGTAWEGITINRDKKDGNYVITSLGKTEHTFAGEVPATMLISREGRKLIHDNRGLLQDIVFGPEDAELIGEGMEGKVYAIMLDVGATQKEYALKYIFPVMPDAVDSAYIFMPGIQTMRLMQQAEKEKPVHGLKYAVPVLATIDMTLSPYIENNTNLSDILDYYAQVIKYNRSSHGTLHDQPRDTTHDMIDEIAHYDRQHSSDDSKFMTQVNICLERAETQLSTWMQEKKRQDPVLQAARIDPIRETGIPQSTLITLKPLYDLFTKFKTDPSFNAGNPEFMDELMQMCTVVEMTTGIVENRGSQ